MKKLLAVALVSFALIGAGCGGGEKKEDKGAGGGAAATAAAKPCTKCKCANWSDANGDGKCDTMVDGKPCDHAAADHAAAAPAPK